MTHPNRTFHSLKFSFKVMWSGNYENGICLSQIIRIRWSKPINRVKLKCIRADLNQQTKFTILIKSIIYHLMANTKLVEDKVTHKLNLLLPTLFVPFVVTEEKWTRKKDTIYFYMWTKDVGPTFGQISYSVLIWFPPGNNENISSFYKQNSPMKKMEAI